MDDSTILSISTTSDSNEELRSASDSDSTELHAIFASTQSSSSRSIIRTPTPVPDYYDSSDDEIYASNVHRVSVSDWSLDSDDNYVDSDEDTSLAGVTNEEIERYTFPYKFKVETSVDSNLVESCSICISPFLHQEDVRRLPCFHQFHTKCVDVWLKKSALCPNCNTNIVTGAGQQM